MRITRTALAALLALVLLAAGCGDDDTTTDEPAAQESADTAPAASSGAGVRQVSPTDAAAIHADPPADLVVLDVRTPEEFAEGHLDGAIMIDFYEADFADRIGELDPDQPYLLYCRSGNRSGQTAALMTELGFADVADVDGGIVAWANAGLPLVQG